MKMLVLGEFKQTTGLFHRISYKGISRVALIYFPASQKKHPFLIAKIGKWVIDAKPYSL